MLKIHRHEGSLDRYFSGEFDGGAGGLRGSTPWLGAATEPCVLHGALPCLSMDCPSPYDEPCSAHNILRCGYQECQAIDSTLRTWRGEPCALHKIVCCDEPECEDPENDYDAQRENYRARLRIQERLSQCTEAQARILFACFRRLDLQGRPFDGSRLGSYEFAPPMTETEVNEQMKGIVRPLREYRFAVLGSQVAVEVYEEATAETLRSPGALAPIASHDRRLKAFLEDLAARSSGRLRGKKDRAQAVALVERIKEETQLELAEALHAFGATLTLEGLLMPEEVSVRELADAMHLHHSTVTRRLSELAEDPAPVPRGKRQAILTRRLQRVWPEAHQALLRKAAG